MTTIDPSVSVRRSTPEDQRWLEQRLRESWGSLQVVRRSQLIDASLLSAFVAEHDGDRVGLATYAIDDGRCEVVTIDAFVESIGVGTALLSAVAEQARQHGCREMWLITTNDNLRALRFYQRRGMRLAALYAGALTESRRLKPTIAQIGMHGIALRDELELVLDLGPELRDGV